MMHELQSLIDKNSSIPDGWIYIGNDQERYVLGQPGKRNLLVFGVNPSTAVAGKDDPTIRKVRSISKHDGYDGWIMVNLYPVISTDPNQLPEEADSQIVKNNLEVLCAIANSYYIDRIWAAWGDIIEKRGYLGSILYDVQEALYCIDAEWFYRGSLTKRGNPRHPLYMKLEESLNMFPVADYASIWKTF
ncbi:MAG: DUF1643 domain-containing protein [Lachnospiraceae bacterium]|nr:DUF1643 domain-containing protein [Lachnospiraceae bacterium]